MWRVVGHWGLTLCTLYGGGGPEDDRGVMFDKNNEKSHIQDCLHKQLLMISRYVRPFTPGTPLPPSLPPSLTSTPLPPPVPHVTDKRWCEKPQASHISPFWSISVTGRARLPFVHRRGEAGHTGQKKENKIGPDPAETVWIRSPLPSGLITRPFRGYRPSPRRWGHSPPRQEAAVDTETESVRKRGSWKIMLVELNRWRDWFFPKSKDVFCQSLPLPASSKLWWKQLRMEPRNEQAPGNTIEDCSIDKFRP